MSQLSVDARQRILKAAEEIFAARGIEGARVDEIASKAKINKRMIYHYFGSKEGLYTEVLRLNFHKILDTGKRAFKERKGLEERVEEAIKNYFYSLASNPQYPRLMAWEALQGGRYARQILPQLRTELLPELRLLLTEGIEKGVFRPTLDLEETLTTVITLCSAFFSGKDLLSMLWERDPLSPGNLERRLRHIIELIMRYIRP